MDPPEKSKSTSAKGTGGGEPSAPKSVLPTGKSSRPTSLPPSQGGGALPGPGPKSVALPSAPKDGKSKSLTTEKSNDSKAPVPMAVHSAPKEPASAGASNDLFPPSVPGKTSARMSASLPPPTATKPTAEPTAAPPPAPLPKPSGPSLPSAASQPAPLPKGPTSLPPPSQSKGAMSLPPPGDISKIGAPLPTAGGSPKGPTSLPPPSSTAGLPKGPASLPPPSSAEQPKKPTSLPPPSDHAKPGPALPTPGGGAPALVPTKAEPKKEQSKAKWSGDRNSSVTGGTGSSLNAAANDDSSTTSLLYKAPSNLGQKTGASSANKGAAAPRPTLSVTGPSKKPPSTSKSASMSTKEDKSKSTASVPAALPPPSASTSASSATSSGSSSAAAKPSGSGGGNEDGFTIPLPAIPFNCQALEDLWNAIVANADGITSYWGIHLLSILTIIGLNAYKRNLQ